MKSEKPKGKMTPVLKKITNYSDFSVDINIFTNNFTPKVDPDGGFDVFAFPPPDANNKKQYVFTSRAVQKIDCGFDFIISQGYKMYFELNPTFITKGVFCNTSFLPKVEKQRLVLDFYNIGKEIISIDNGCKVGKMYVTSNYVPNLVIKNDI